MVGRRCHLPRPPGLSRAHQRRDDQRAPLAAGPHEQRPQAQPYSVTATPDLHLRTAVPASLTGRRYRDRWVTLAGPVKDQFVISDPMFYKTTLHFALKADSASLERILTARPSGRFPIDLTTPARAPKRRRHCRGGLRPMVAPRVRKFIAHGMTMKGDNTGAPWTFTMPVTRRTEMTP